MQFKVYLPLKGWNETPHNSVESEDTLLIPYGKAAVISVFLHMDSKGEAALDRGGSCRLNMITIFSHYDCNIALDYLSNNRAPKLVPLTKGSLLGRSTTGIFQVSTHHHVSARSTFISLRKGIFLKAGRWAGTARKRSSLERSSRLHYTWFTGP